MKNLANCKPSEFFVQTNRVRKAVSKWLTLTEIREIRRRMPEVKEDATEAERKDALYQQALKNTDAMLDAIFELHPQETLELMALLCFVEPENVDDYSMHDYLQSLHEMLSDSAVTGFFTSLLRLGQTNG